jgi:hypothetical protein
MLADAIFAENELLANKHRHDAACRSAVSGSILPVFPEQLYDIIIGGGGGEGVRGWLSPGKVHENTVSDVLKKFGR